MNLFAFMNKHECEIWARCTQSVAKGGLHRTY